MLTTVFTVSGPHRIHRGKARYVERMITEETMDRFWEDHSEVAEKRGCYIFALRSGRGFTPWYVGKSGRSFKKEVFDGEKPFKYNQVISDEYGSPVFFFVLAPKSRRKLINRHITELERMLIRNAKIANPAALNKQNKDIPWVIARVMSPGKGPDPQEVLDFWKMLPSLGSSKKSTKV